MLTDELQFRPADVERDLEFAYHYLFKPGIEKLVKDLNGGVWPEAERHQFFKKGFTDPGMMMITHDGLDVGCFCISNTEKAVVLQRVYLLPAFQRQGIGQKLIGLALEKAEELKKPLELEVLANNVQALNAYKKSGFEQISGVIVNGWNQKVVMRHKDTFKFAESLAEAALAPVPVARMLARAAGRPATPA